MIPRSLVLALVGLVAFAPLARSSEKDDAARRGRQALLTKAFNTPPWALRAYEDAWRQWDSGLEERPVNYPQDFMERYGLHPAPYDNGKYPMGLGQGPGLFGKGLTTDCMLCHAGSILGKSYVGLGNTTLDVHALFEELNRASGNRKPLPFTFSNVRGTSEAGAFGVYLLAHRQPDLKVRLTPLELDLCDTLCEDVPAWWLLQKKQTMYYTGATPARSVRSLMQFMLASTNGPAFFHREEPTFRDIQAYLLSLTPPKYPFPIDQERARTGEKIFLKNCATCHGTYGANWTYPNKIIPLDVIGTDRTRYHGISVKWGHYYNQGWFAREKSGWFGDEYQARLTSGYQAPPLDGVWATAPYLHNGSVPTLHHLLNSKTRPKIFTRSYRTDEESYDREKGGWKVQVLDRGADPGSLPIERRKVYDTGQPGRGNAGHTFGDDLSEQERRAVIEYLKTL